MSRRRLAIMVAGAVALLLCCAVPVQAALLTLSTHASDGNNPPGADKLDATFEFSVVSGQLLLTVSNLTPEGPLDPALNIDEIYFNAKDNITNLNLVGVTLGSTGQWDWGFIQGGGPSDIGNPHQVNSFGKFDVYVKDDPVSNPHRNIASGGSVTFTFDITGTAPVDTDFIELSTQVDGHTISYAAAKFYNGPPEMSAYGATNVPEPATIALLGLGALVLLRKRKRA